MAREALAVKVSNASIKVENDEIVDRSTFKSVLAQKEFLIQPLYKVLKNHSEAARREAEMFRTDFSGKISIQGDTTIPYSILTRVMYTCGQAGYPVMNLVVYRKE
jgi:biopolymer transport protein ExbD